MDVLDLVGARALLWALFFPFRMFKFQLCRDEGEVELELYDVELRPRASTCAFRSSTAW